MSVLLVTPGHDASTRSVEQWAKRLEQLFQGAVTMYRITPATRADVDLELGNYTHVFYFGHGMTDCLYIPKTVRADEILIDEHNVAGTNRIVVAVACWAGDTLAPTVTGSTPVVTAFIGWAVELSWPISSDKPFEDAVVDGLATLLQGGTVADTVDELKLRFQQAHDDYRNTLLTTTRGKDRIRLAMLQAAYWDQQVHCWGDHTATL